MAEEHLEIIRINKKNHENQHLYLLENMWISLTAT